MSLERICGLGLAVTRPIVTIVYNTTIYVVKFRIRLIRAIQDEGYKVVVLSPRDESCEELEKLGIAHRHIPMSQYGMNPLHELKTMRAITAEMRSLKPVVSLHYTIKPNIFGTLAAKKAGVPVVNNVAGTGRAFTTGNIILRRLITGLYRRAFKHSAKVFFQNGDDLDTFLKARILPESKTLRIPGSGVDLDQFALAPYPNNTPHFLFIGRLLKEKGISEFIEAATWLKKRYPHARFHIVGEFEEHPLFVAKSILDSAVETKVVEYHGAVPPAQIAALITEASCIVLPSYYGEGVPRVLLEACASGRPIITTDNVGCRDVVLDGINGFMVKTRDVKDLRNAISRFIETPFDEQRAMGRAARERVETKFDERFVLEAYLKAIQQEAKIP